MLWYKIICKPTNISFYIFQRTFLTTRLELFCENNIFPIQNSRSDSTDYCVGQTVRPSVNNCHLVEPLLLQGITFSLHFPPGILCKKVKILFKDFFASRCTFKCKFYQNLRIICRPKIGWTNLDKHRKTQSQFLIRICYHHRMSFLR